MPAAVATIERYGADATGLACAFAPHLQGDFARNPDLCMTDKRVPQLSVAANAYGRKAVVGWLIGQLEDLFRMAGARTASDIGAIHTAAEAVLTAYPSLRLTDIMLFLTRFKAGVYGRFYGQTDPLAVTEALARYMEERREALGRIGRRQERARTIERNLELFGRTEATLDELRGTSMWAAMDGDQRGWCERFAAFFDAGADNILDKFRFHLTRKEGGALWFTLDRVFHRGHLEAYAGRGGKEADGG